jgi:hypothetical protein
VVDALPHNFPIIDRRAPGAAGVADHACHEDERIAPAQRILTIYQNTAPSLLTYPHSVESNSKKLK